MLLAEVIRNMVPFMVLFFGFTCATAMIMHVLGIHLHVYDESVLENTSDMHEPDDGVSSVYNGLGYFGHFIFMLRNSLGMFDVTPF